MNTNSNQPLEIILSVTLVSPLSFFSSMPYTLTHILSPVIRTSYGFRWVISRYHAGESTTVSIVTVGLILTGLLV